MSADNRNPPPRARLLSRYAECLATANGRLSEWRERTLR